MKFDFASFSRFPDTTVAILETEPGAPTVMNVACSGPNDSMDEQARKNRALSLCLQMTGVKMSEAKILAANLINSNPQR
jgi:hypothetical protein